MSSREDRSGTPALATGREILDAVEKVERLMERMIDGRPMHLAEAAAYLTKGVRGRITHVALSQHEIQILFYAVQRLGQRLADGDGYEQE